MFSRNLSVHACRGSRKCIGVASIGAAIAWVLMPPHIAHAQAIDSLVQKSLATSPRMLAASARVTAAESRVGPAGVRPDPMLMAGVQNLPAFSPGFGDEMTMKMIGISQTIPRGGKLGSAKAVAAADVLVAREARRGVALELERDIRLAAYDAAYADRALAVIERNRGALVDLISAAEIRFGTGSAGSGASGMAASGQSSGLADLLRARVEAARLGEQASMLLEQRRAAIGTLNALLGRSDEAPVDSLAIPSALERAAVAESCSDVRFESAVLGSRAAASPLLPVDSLQALARSSNAEVRMRAAMAAVQAARVDLAVRERKPDIEASLQYGQRDGFADMITATLSIPLQLHRKDRQDRYVIAERADLTAAEAESEGAARQVNADIARLHAMAERSRTQLALYKTAMIPQAQLGVDAALVAFRSGTGSLRAVLDAQTMVFNAEVEYHQALLEFARTIAELQQVVGAEVLK